MSKKKQFIYNLLEHFENRELPFKIEDVKDFDISTGMITLENDEHPYIIRIEKLPIESDFPQIPTKEYKHVPMDIEIFSRNDVLDAITEEKEFFWKDHSGRRFTNTFNVTELLDAFGDEVDDEEDFKYWIETCEVGDEYDSGTPNEIKRIK